MPSTDHNLAYPSLLINLASGLAAHFTLHYRHIPWQCKPEGFCSGCRTCSGCRSCSGCNALLNISERIVLVHFSCSNSLDYAILTCSKNAVCSSATYVDAFGSMMPPFMRTWNLL